MREIDALAEDQRRLHTAVRDERVAVELSEGPPRQAAIFTQAVGGSLVAWIVPRRLGGLLRLAWCLVLVVLPREAVDPQASCSGIQMSSFVLMLRR
jgi:hypothetical protein